VDTYDIVMLVVLAGATLFGAIKGFAWQVASVASLAISYYVAYRFREPFSEAIKADPPWNRFLAMLILYVGTSLVIWVAFRMVSRSIDRMKLKDFDRQLGALIGLAKGGLICTLITMFAVALCGPKIREQIVQSRSGFYIAKVLDQSDLVIPPELHEVVSPYIERFENQIANPNRPADPPLQMPWSAAGNSPVEASDLKPPRVLGREWFEQQASGGLPPVR